MCPFSILWGSGSTPTWPRLAQRRVDDSHVRDGELKRRDVAVSGRAGGEVQLAAGAQQPVRKSALLAIAVTGAAGGVHTGWVVRTRRRSARGRARCRRLPKRGGSLERGHKGRRLGESARAPPPPTAVGGAARQTGGAATVCGKVRRTRRAGQSEATRRCQDFWDGSPAAVAASWCAETHPCGLLRVLRPRLDAQLLRKVPLPRVVLIQQATNVVQLLHSQRGSRTRPRQRSRRWRLA